MTPEEAKALRGRGIGIEFGGLTALSGVDIEIVGGQVHGLIGPNGAGKSTLINCLTGLQRGIDGAVFIDGRDVTRWSPERRAGAGLARTFQTPRFDRSATVWESLMVAAYARSRSQMAGAILRTPRMRREERAAAREVEQVLGDFQFSSIASSRIESLSLWQLRVLEVARATIMRPKYLFLDEPAAGLDDAERQLLAGHIADVRARGAGVLLVEHDFAFVRELADTITVLERGRVLAVGSPAEIAHNPTVVDAYLGVVDARTH